MLLTVFPVPVSAVNKREEKSISKERMIQKHIIIRVMTRLACKHIYNIDNYLGNCDLDTFSNIVQLVNFTF